MSVQAISWALAQKLGTPSMKILLIAVANYADEHGVAWPSQQRIATDTQLGERTVRRLLKQLEKLELLTREKRPPAKSGLRRTDVLHLQIGDAVKMSGGEEGANKPTKKRPPAKMSGGEKTAGQNGRYPPATVGRPYVNLLRDNSSHVGLVGIVEHRGAESSTAAGGREPATPFDGDADL